MKRILVFLIFSLIVFNISCRKDFETIPSFGNLEFSKDTVYLDTIFSNIGSATYNLKVYNRSNKDITIPEIKLRNGVNSNYRLNVDGSPGKEFKSIDVLANDSIHVFIETTIDFNSITDPLYTDQLVFDNGNNEQSVELVTLVQDAYFIFPNKTGMGIETLTFDGKDSEIQGRFLTDEELNFTSDKPYVIYGYAAVPSGKTLTINSGSNIHFHRNSGLIINTGASLKAIGSLENKITFKGDRLEHAFDDISGQWGTIWFRTGSLENEIEHAIIKNGVIGMLVDGLTTTETLVVRNAEIYNNSAYGILGRNTNIRGENLVIGNAGRSSLACIFGGKYNFTHATFANYWNQSLRQLPSVLLNNYITYTNDANEEITEKSDLIEANFVNCIIEGNNNVEFILDNTGNTVFNYNLNNCLVRFNDINNSFSNIPELNFNDTNHYKNNILNGNPYFKDVFKNNFQIQQNSDAINKGALTPVTKDILGIDRTPTIDIGAYQHTPE